MGQHEKRKIYSTVKKIVQDHSTKDTVECINDSSFGGSKSSKINVTINKTIIDNDRKYQT